ncbi:peptidylprolyl isomerase [Paenibacillus koleovorans]|uniref:peptidylprolyl isomerase n=1 Tax=Paenibacillus koleovorans TaxID=121608 RepID=UPI000FDB2644|nr:peptidylprolyl isomerase [Paenibacillus koleovorans]
MRSVRLLWIVIVCLLACILALTMLWSAALRAKKGAEPPNGEQPGGNGASIDEQQAVATIGGKTIRYGELRSRLEERYGAELLDQLIEREAIRQEAEALQVTVSPAEIDNELARMQQGYESERAFYASMKEQIGLTRSELVEDVYYKLLLERLAIRGIQVTDGEVQTYIKEHPEEFKSFTQYHLLKIEVKTKEEANKIIADWTKGFDFGVLAKERSTDKATGAGGGDIGWVEETDPFVPASITQAARALKINELSRPIALKEGFAVIQLVGKKEVNKTIDETTKAFIRNELALQKAVPLKELAQSIRQKHKATVLLKQFQ